LPATGGLLDINLGLSFSGVVRPRFRLAVSGTKIPVPGAEKLPCRKRHLVGVVARQNVVLRRYLDLELA
jgi:hypothetical protein